MVVDPAGVHAASREVGVIENVAQETDVAANAAKSELGKRPRGARHGGAEIRRRRIADHLGKQGVEGGAGSISRIAEAIRAHPRPARRFVDRQGAASRPDGAVFADGFHVDASLNGIAARLGDIGRFEAEFAKGRARRESNLRLYDVDARDLLGHRVLHLQPRVGLDEREWPRVAAIRGIDEEFEGAEVGVAFVMSEAYRGIDDGVSHVDGQPGRGCHLDDLLMATLDAALALAEVRDGTVEVANDLHFHVARVG